MILIAALCGACLGLGLLLVARGLKPPRPALAEVLAAHRAYAGLPQIATQPEASWGPLARLGRPLTGRTLRSDLPSLVPVATRRDLVVLQRSLHQHLAEKVGTAAVGFLFPAVAAALLSVAGVSFSLAVPVGAALGLAVVGFFIPDFAARSEGARRRREFRQALAAFIDLVRISLAGGIGVEGALRDAADIGHGWTFEHLQHAVEVARVTRETPWDALARLGSELGIDELEEMAASVGLAGTDGAKVGLSLAARSKSQRDHELAEAESEALQATERMSLPVVLMFVGFLLFLAFPAVIRIVGIPGG